MRRDAILFLFAGTLVTASAQTAGDFFDDSVLHELRFTIHPSDWSRLRANFLDNTYYPCNMQWRGLLAENIGIRSRGLGTRSGDKPGLRVDFDRYELNQQFLGLKSFVLDNLVQDASMIKERLTMLLFRRMGLPAPREAHTRLYVNGEYAGVYAIVESIDKRFLRQNFGEDEGYLYEYQWKDAYRFEYKGSDPALYSPSPFKPETNETNPDPAPLEAMIRTMNQASDSDFQRAMAEFVDLRLFLTHVAVENFLAEWDGIVGQFGLNNFYLYRFNRRNLHQFLVWDKDNTFGGQISGSRARIEYWPFTGVNENVLTRRSLNVPELESHFLESLYRAAQMAGGPGGWLEQEIERQYNQIRQAAIEDPKKRCPDATGVHQPCTNAQFEAEIAFLRQFARERSDVVIREVLAAGYVPAGAPQVAEGGVVNAATFERVPVAPGSLISVFGERLAQGTTAAASLPLPTELAGAAIRINGIAAPLLFASPSQVNLQVPWEVSPGTASLSAAAGGATGGPVTIEIGEYSPGIFAVTHADGITPVSVSRPAGSGDVLVIYANGLGPVSPSVTTGQEAPSAPLSSVQQTPRVTVGGVEAQILFAGLTPGFVGLYQVNVQLGPGVTAGSGTPLVVSVGGRATPPTGIATR